MAAKSKAKKPVSVKKPAKKAPPAKKPSKKVIVAKPAKVAMPKPAPRKEAAPSKEAAEKLKKRARAEAAMEAALAEGAAEGAEAEDQEEEFDPAAFFAASGGKGDFRAHVMRKERVDLNLTVRYRFLKGPLVFNAELLNLSKGGLCLRTEEAVKVKTIIRIEIPLPHTSELFAVQAEVVWSESTSDGSGNDKPIHTGLRFKEMSLAKQAVINQFIQQRRDEVIMAKIGLDKFTDSVPVAGLD